jgi:hypothetical protein
MIHNTYYLNLDLKGKFASTVILDNQCWLLMTYILRKTTLYHHWLGVDKIHLYYPDLKREVFPDLTTDRIYKIVKHLVTKGFLDKIKKDPQQNIYRDRYRINNLDNILAVRKTNDQ